MAIAGDDSVYVNLGYCFDTGKGVRKSKSHALYWYRRASRRGASGGAHNIGTIYRADGRFKAARKWFLRAIEKGSPGSAIDVAKLSLAHGKPKVARRYLEYALTQRDWMSEYEVEEAEALLKSLTE